MISVAEATMGEQRRAPGAVLLEGWRQGHVPKLREGLRKTRARPLHDLRHQRLQAALQALYHPGTESRLCPYNWRIFVKV